MGHRSPQHGSAAVRHGRVDPSGLCSVTTQYAKALPDVRFNAADPGYTATDFNNHSGPQTITEGTDAIVQLATEDPSAGTGRFIDRHGRAAW
ncbi:MAG: hypothetical protein JO168_27315 [Solirubrobacterales bacterium]|nr:hypothetical protein [Solirubrobacterales bacterium]